MLKLTIDNLQHKNKITADIKKIFKMNVQPRTFLWFKTIDWIEVWIRVGFGLVLEYGFL